MKRPSAKIRDEIARLQEQLKAAETREAERIGRIALKAGLGELEIDDAELQVSFEDVAKCFRGGHTLSTGGEKGDGWGTAGASTATVSSGATQGGDGEA